MNPRKLKLFLINIDTLVNYMNEKSPLNLIEDNKIQSYELDHQLFVDQFLRSSEYSSSRILFPQKNKNVTLEDFTIKKLIGKGSSGKIYLAEKISNKKIFAIKVQNKLHILQNNNLEKIQIEKKILAQFNHPLLVKLHFSF